MILSKKFLTERTVHSKFRPSTAAYPERILQIGEGVFLRGFFGWLMHQLNQNCLYDGKIVVVSPRPSGADNVRLFNEQNGLYTVWLRGNLNGHKVDSTEIVESVSRAINPYSDWAGFLACADDPQIEIIISNTTEAGLRFEEEPAILDRPLNSFPAKLTAYLYRRYTTFSGDASAGMTIVPCELVEDNGERLRELVLMHSKYWGLPRSFENWICTSNHFCNTLVDRIVAGYPDIDDDDLYQTLGYRDRLVTVGEPYHLWVIEGGASLESRWPFKKIGLNVRFVEDVTPYWEVKLRILNGAHTALAAVAYLAGFNTVGAAMSNQIIKDYMDCLIKREIEMALNNDISSPDILNQFSDSVIERFKNPYLNHNITSILANAAMKVRLRLVPTLLDYQHQFHRLPELLVAAFAAQFIYYSSSVNMGVPGELVDGHQMTESLCMGEETSGLQTTIERMLQQEIWGTDLATIPHLVEELGRIITSYRSHGVLKTIDEITKRQAT